MRTIFFAVFLLGILNAEFVKYADINYDLEQETQRLNTLDIYKPKGRVANLPVMVYVHGGGWAIGDKSRVHHKAQLFTEEQYVFVSINYRLSPFPAELDNKDRVRFPDHPHDVGEAISWVYQNIEKYGGNNKHIFLIGHSAGAHLVALVTTDSQYLKKFDTPPSIIRGTCALDGANYHIPDHMPISGSQLHFNAFGTEEENKITNHWEQASPTIHADKNDAPMLLVTQKNRRTRVEQNERLAQALGNGKVYLVDKNHKQINVDLGNPKDVSAMTMVVMSFFANLR